MFHVVPCAEAGETYVCTSFMVWEARCREDNVAYKYKVLLKSSAVPMPSELEGIKIS